MKRKLYQKIGTIIVSCLFLFMAVLPFCGALLVGVGLPAKYRETYYGEFYAMYQRLESLKSRKKIVVIGNSNVAFGLDSALAERLLKEAGLDYAVCNFGLYGALGTKMMLDLSNDFIQKEDVVIFTPELDAQSLSLYFSGKEAWYAIDGDAAMFSAFPTEEKGELVGNFFGYVADKYALHISGKNAEGSGVYVAASFDEHCDLKNYDRPYNVLPNLVDVNNPLSFDISQFGKGFIGYVNDWYAQIKRKGAEMYYSFAPMNQKAFIEGIADAEAFHDFIAKSFDFPVIGYIEDYIMEAEWFYDSNFHLNEYGMTVRTVNLVNDLKTEWGNDTKTQVILPNKPVVPEQGLEGEGDNSHADCFTYALTNGYYTITGLTDKGKNSVTLIIPYQVDGIYVKEMNADVFVENDTLECVTFQKNIKLLIDNSFCGCDRLSSIILCHDVPADISVGYGILNGVSKSCKILVPNKALSAFQNDYFWGRYAERLQGYV